MEEAGIRLSLAGRRELAAGLQEGAEGFEELGDAAEEAGRKGEQSGRKWEKTRGILSGISRGIMTGVKITAGVATAAGAIGIKTAASMETARIGFTTMLGSGRKARKFLGDLADFAAKTPFGFPELQTASSRLVSAGVDTKKIIPMMTTLGDVTAGMGTGSEGITRATNALQQMIAAQRISAEDLNQLRDAGIPVYDLLSKALGKTKEEVVGLKDEGKLGGEALAAMLGALETGKGLEKFNGLMAKQSSSLEGRWSTLKDTVQMGLADAVKPAIPLVKDLLGVANDLAVQAMPKIQSALKTGTRYVRDFMKAWKQGGGGKSGLAGAMAALDAPGIPKSAGQIGDAVEKIGDSIKGVDWDQVKTGLGDGVADTISVTGVAVGFLADHIDTLAKYLPALIAAYAAWKAAQAAGNAVAILSVPIIVAQTASNFALASSNRALATATGTAAVSQRGLNLALLANPIGLVIAAAALLIGGFILLYKKSDTFRALVDTLWNSLLKPFAQWIGGVLLDGILALASGLLRMGEYGVMAFKILVTAAFKAFDNILMAAEVGLGWIPGLGDKISGARAAFDRFGDAVVNKLQRVEDKLRSTREQVDQLAKDRNATITINTTYTGGRSLGKERQIEQQMGIPGVAGGGHLQARQPHIVGERRAELFIPSVSGRLMPSVPDSPAALEDIDPSAFDDFRGDTMPLGIIEMSLDGDVVGRAVIGRVNDKVART